MSGEAGDFAPAAPEHSGLRRFAELFRLTPAECDVVRVLLAVELRPAVGPMLDKLSGRSDGRPTAAVLAALVAGSGAEAASGLLASLAPGERLHAAGVIDVSGERAFPARTVALLDGVWQRLAELPARLPYAVFARGGTSLGHVDIAPSTRVQAERAVVRARGTPGSALVVVSGAAEHAPESLAVAIANEIGLSAVMVSATELDAPGQLRHVRREATWLDAAIVVRGSPSSAASSRLAEEVEQPIIVIADSPSAFEPSSLPGRWRLDVELADLPLAERVACWRRNLAGVPLQPGLDLVSHAGRLSFGAARIAKIAAAAREHARTNGGGLTAEGLRLASRTGFRLSSGLARRLESVAGLADVVVPTATRRELELACAWARHGVTAFRSDVAGRPLRDRNGLVCLFHGPPGTGKTLAARAIAGEMGADLLRIDLSQVVDKYIGETEKNLATVFSEADGAGAILFFDEADALFGKRGETKDAHDRYANIEVAFLLQRLEEHAGVCILATNLRQNLDAAFSRRFQVIAEFPLPGADERREIWERHLVREHVASDVDFGELARRFALAGGDISNAAATALVLAADAGTPVAMRHLVVGVWREIKKSGRLVAADDFGPWRDTIKALDRR